MYLIFYGFPEIVTETDKTDKKKGFIFLFANNDSILKGMNDKFNSFIYSISNFYFKLFNVFDFFDDYVI